MGERVTITGMSYGPEGVGRLANGLVVFVPETTPGDVAEVVVTSEHPTYCRGRVLRLLEAGPERVDGVVDNPNPVAVEALAPWAHLRYAAQLKAKRTSIVDALCKVAGYEHEAAEALVEEVRPSPDPVAYRNKIELVTSTHGPLALGVNNPKSHRFIPVERYPLANERLAAAPKALTGALRYLSGTKDLGVYRVSLRASERTRAFEVGFWTKHGPFPRSSVPAILGDALHPTSIVRLIGQPGPERKVSRLEKLDGAGLWKERLAGVKLAVSAPAFFQVNTAVAEAMVETVRSWIQESGVRHVADLYAGVGTFTIPLLAAGHEVTAIELASAAVQNLRANAKDYEETATVIGGDAAREAEAWSGADVVLLDPPRAGLAPRMPELIAVSCAQELIYVSCDPQTWARDCGRLEAGGFKLCTVVPFDLFPQTYHVEVLSRWRRERPQAEN